MSNEWRKGIILENKDISRGSKLLKIKSLDNDLIDYEPGNVISLGINISQPDKFRHAYTITKSDHNNKTFEIIYRVIPDGKLTPTLSQMVKNTFVCFRGKFHNPILEEMNENAEKFIGISTGTGIGPLYGFIEKVLKENLVTIPIILYSGFRYEEDICLKNELEQLKTNYKNFDYYFTLTNPSLNWNGLKGRVTESIPSLLKNLEKNHFHLVGNGNMIGEFSKALKENGVLDENISTESYFNHSGKTNTNIESIKKIIERFN